MAQYDSIGKAYIEGQKTETAKRDDWARNFIRQSLPPKLSRKYVLDLGCGQGLDLLWAEEMGADAYGIDESSYMVQEAQKVVHHPERVILGTMQELKFPGIKFHHVFGRFSVHYLKEFDELYSQLYHLLAPHGTLTLVAHHPFADVMRVQGTRRYGVQQEVTSTLFDNAVPITFQTHTFENYLSETFLKLFILTKFKECSDRFEPIPGTLLPYAFGIQGKAV